MPHALLHNALKLGLVIGVAAALLALIQWTTKAPIIEAQQQYEQQTLQAVFPTTEPVDIIAYTSTSWSVCHQQQPLGRIDKLTTLEGYSGSIELLVGMTLDQSIKAVRVLQHKETPGLGDDIEKRKSDWIDQFESKSLTATNASNWAIRKDGGTFDQLTGASITSRAMVNRIKRHLDELPSPLTLPCYD